MWGKIKLNALVAVSLLLCGASIAASQDKEKKEMPAGTPILWEEVDIKSRDLFLGPGGAAMQPNLKGMSLIGPQTGGNNRKYRIKDGSGREWVAKIADESQPEVAAVRLLWGIGYRTEVDYLVPRLEINKLGSFSNVRFEARPEKIKRGDRWLWADNPFRDSNAFAGLRIMMAMFNNWDLKDENNAILIDGDKHYYIVSDLGSSFGKLAKSSETRSGRSVNNPEDFAQSVFVKGTKDGYIDFAYTGAAAHLVQGIKVEHGRWLADLLLQLSDKQIQDAFRAANYSPEDAALLTAAFKARINELDRATRETVAEQ